MSDPASEQTVKSTAPADAVGQDSKAPKPKPLASPSLDKSADQAVGELDQSTVDPLAPRKDRRSASTDGSEGGGPQSFKSQTSISSAMRMHFAETPTMASREERTRSVVLEGANAASAKRDEVKARLSKIEVARKSTLPPLLDESDDDQKDEGKVSQMEGKLRSVRQMREEQDDLVSSQQILSGSGTWWNVSDRAMLALKNARSKQGIKKSGFGRQGSMMSTRSAVSEMHFHQEEDMQHLEDSDDDGSVGKLTGTIRQLLYALKVAKKLKRKAEVVRLRHWRNMVEKARSTGQHIQAMPELFTLMKGGIPSDIRGRVWKEFLGVEEKRKMHHCNYYKLLRESADYVLSIKDSTPEWLQQIQKDVPRTLGGVPKFKTVEGRKELERVLVCYYYRNPQAVGYCQGMNMLAAGLLTQMNEEDAFWALVCVIESRIGYYTRSMVGLLVDQRVFQSILAYTMPKLYQHMRKNELLISAFTTSWFMCLFMETPVPYGVAIYVWDYLFCYGDEMLFQVSLAILKASRSKMLKMNDPGTLLMYTLGLGKELKRDVLQGISSRVGQLMQSISLLRSTYQIDVLRDHKRIKSTSELQRLMKRYLIKTPDEVQKLWVNFLSPSPWSILVQNCIPNNLVWFSSALSQAAYPNKSQEWIEAGLVSGVMRRLFDIVDVHGTGQISFDNFTWLVRILTTGQDRNRARLAFQFFDFDKDNAVGIQDLYSGMKRLYRMYKGNSPDAHACAQLWSNEFLIWYEDVYLGRVAKGEDTGVVVKKKLKKKPFGLRLSERPFSRSRKLLRVDSIVRKEAYKKGIQAGWHVLAINNQSVEGWSVRKLGELCRKTKVPCTISFHAPRSQRISAKNMTRAMPTLMELCPFVKEFFFSRDQGEKSEEGKSRSARSGSKSGKSGSAGDASDQKKAKKSLFGAIRHGVKGLFNRD